MERHRQDAQQLLLGFLFVLPLILVWDLPNKTELPRWQAAMFFAPLACLFWLARSDLRPAWSRAHTLVVLALGVHVLLGLAHMDTPGVQQALQQQVTLALFFFLGAQYFSDTKGRLRLLQVTVACGALLALIGIAQHLSGSNLGLPVVYSNKASLFANKNYAGAFLDLATPAAFMLLLGARERRLRQFYAAGFFLCLSYSLACLSRGHWLGLAAAFVVLIIHIRRDNRGLAFIRAERSNLRLAGGLAVAALAVFLLPTLYAEQPIEKSALLNSVASPESAASRLEFYRNTLAMIADHPLEGVGPGGFYTAFQAYFGAPVPLGSVTELTGVAHAHNDYLEYLAELGIPGGLVIFTLLGVFWAGAWKAASKPSETVVRLQNMGFLAGMTAIFTHALVDFPLSHPVTSVYLWTWAGALSSFWRPDKEKSLEVEAAPLKRMRPVLVLLVSVYLILTGIQAYRTLQGYWLSSQAAKATKAKQCGKALDYADRAFNLASKDYLIWHYYTLVSGYCENTLRGRYLAAERVLAEDKNHPNALLMKANVLYQAGDMEGAEQVYRRLTELLPHRLSGYLGMANTLAAQEKTDLADNYYDKARKIKRGLGGQAYPGPAGKLLAALSVRATGDQQWAIERPKDHSISIVVPGKATASGGTDSGPPPVRAAGKVD